MPQSCSICLQDGADSFLSCCLQGCTAAFHEECAKEALAWQARCPVCRRDAQQRILAAPDAFMALRDFCCTRYSQMETRLLTVLEVIGPKECPSTGSSFLWQVVESLRRCSCRFSVALGTML